MQSSFLELEKGRIHFYRFGDGPRLLIAFHGFGDSAGLFGSLQSLDQYTVIALDLPYHGRTRWRAPKYDIADIDAMVSAVLAREGRKTFTGLGFSFGGRIWLSSICRFASRLEALWLIAPDGLGTRGMAFPLIVPLPLRRLLVRAMQKPDWLLALAANLRRLRLLDAFSLRFLHFFLNNKERRRCLLHTWLSLDAFRVCRRKVRQQLRESRLKATFVLGRQDELISIPVVRRFAAGLEHVGVLTRKGDHYSLIDRELAALIVKKGKIKN
jgi:pimeloyl-ACP methyl ester carboxylesterase